MSDPIEDLFAPEMDDELREAKDAEWRQMVNAFVQDNLGSTDLAFGFLMGALSKLHEQSRELAELRARDEAAKAAIERVDINWRHPVGPPGLVLSARSIIESQWPGLPDDLDALTRAYADGGQDR